MSHFTIHNHLETCTAVPQNLTCNARLYIVEMLYTIYVYVYLDRTKYYTDWRQTSESHWPFVCVSRMRFSNASIITLAICPSTALMTVACI